MWFFLRRGLLFLRFGVGFCFHLEMRECSGYITSKYKTLSYIITPSHTLSTNLITCELELENGYLDRCNHASIYTSQKEGTKSIFIIMFPTFQKHAFTFQYNICDTANQEVESILQLR